MGKNAPSEGELLVRLQPAAYTDNIADDGMAETRTPRPFLFNGEGWLIGEDYWQGRAVMVVGLSSNLDEEAIDLPWEEAVSDTKRAIGMYVVTRGEAGQFHTFQTAIESAYKARFTGGRWESVG